MRPPNDVRTCLFLGGDVEAIVGHYVSLIPGSAIEDIVHIGKDGPAIVIDFRLGGTPYMALAGNPDVKPSPILAISVLTPDQAETDRLWTALTEGGEEGPCGWLKDRYGVHWQIVPSVLPRLMRSADGATAMRIQSALMTMNKIDIAALEAAHAGDTAVGGH